MIKITKEEAQKIRTMFPDVPIAITNRGKKSSQRHRYVEETPFVLRVIAGTNEQAAEIVAAYDARRRYRRW